MANTPLQNLSTFAIILVIAGIVLTVGADIMQQVRGDSYNSAAVTNELFAGVANTSYTPTYTPIATVSDMDSVNATTVANNTAVAGFNSTVNYAATTPYLASTNNANLTIVCTRKSPENITVKVGSALNPVVATITACPATVTNISHAYLLSGGVTPVIFANTGANVYLATATNTTAVNMSVGAGFDDVYLNVSNVSRFSPFNLANVTVTYQYDPIATHEVEVVMNGHAMVNLTGTSPQTYTLDPGWVNENDLYTRVAFNNASNTSATNISSIMVTFDYYSNFSNYTSANLMYNKMNDFTNYTSTSTTVTPGQNGTYLLDYTHDQSSVSTNVSGYSLEGIQNIADWQQVIGLVLAASIVIGTVMFFFGKGNGGQA